MAKGKAFTPHGLPDATPCPPVLTESGDTTPPLDFVPEGITISPTTDPLANFLIETFVKADELLELAKDKDFIDRELVIDLLKAAIDPERKKELQELLKPL